MLRLNIGSGSADACSALAQDLNANKARGGTAPCLERLEQAAVRYPNLVGLCPEATRYRWMLEEFRVSLFAQHLGTRLPVSSKRLDEQWRKVMTWIEDNPR